MKTSYELDGLRVARARLELRHDGRPVNQARFAQLVGVHPVTMSRIENGKARVSLEVLEGIARALGRSREWVLGNELDEAAEEEARRRKQLTEALEPLVDALLDVAASVRTQSEPASAPAPAAGKAVA